MHLDPAVSSVRYTKLVLAQASSMNPSSDPISETQAEDPAVIEEPTVAPAPAEPPPSYVKLAMRNMVRKRAQSLVHFGLTVTGLLALLIGLSYLTR